MENKFLKFVQSIVEETSTADIAKVDSKLGDKVAKRPKSVKGENDSEGRDDEIEKDKEDKEDDDYEDVKTDNPKGAAVAKSQKVNNEK